MRGALYVGSVATQAIDAMIALTALKQKKYPETHMTAGNGSQMWRAGTLHLIIIIIHGLILWIFAN